ncbi:MAG: nitrogen regulation protein NR(II), partial [Thermodesulfobacteriota bacterium]
KILSFSSPGGVAFRPLNLHEIIDHVILLQKDNVKDKGIYFLKSYDPSIPPVIGDKDGLIQVFLNIIKNSVEATHKGGKISVSTRVLPDSLLVGSQGRPRNIVAIEIEDEGRGIAPEDMSKVFTPFYTNTAGGSGLGLPLAQNIIKGHSGLMEIKSEPGKGTKVSVLIPLTEGSTRNRRIGYEEGEYPHCR